MDTRGALRGRAVHLYGRVVSSGRLSLIKPTQGCRTMALVSKMAEGMISLASGIHCCPSFYYSFAPPASLCCKQYSHVYINTYLTAYRLYMNYRCYQITLQWNIFPQIGAVRSVDWIFIVGAPVWRWLDQYVTLGRTFYCLLLKQEVAAAAQLLPHIVTYSIPRGGHY